MKPQLTATGKPSNRSPGHQPLNSGGWEQPEATAAAFRDDGWLRSGDAAIIDEDGCVFIRGLTKDMYISGGANVYPAEIEQVLGEHPAVAECAVFGVPDER